MRCLACNKPLTDFELTLVRSDGAPEDLCSECRAEVGEELDNRGYYGFNEEEDIMNGSISLYE